MRQGSFANPEERIAIAEDLARGFYLKIYDRQPPSSQMQDSADQKAYRCYLMAEMAIQKLMRLY